MQEIFLQYGLLGAVVIALVWYILRIEKNAKELAKAIREEKESSEKRQREDRDALEKQHKEEREEWKDMIEAQFKRMNEQADEHSRLQREHTSVLASLKTMLENRKI